MDSLGQPRRHQGSRKDSLGGTREAPERLVARLGGTREAGKDQLDSQERVEAAWEAPGRQERITERPGSRQILGWAHGRLPSTD